MNRTKIEWVKNPDGTPGYTWNPITGCLNHIDGMCKGGNFPCYAYKLANGRLRSRYLANTNLAKGANGGVAKLTIAGQTAIEREGDYADPFYPRFWPERLGQPYIYEKPCRIFVCDMGELFGDWVPEVWQREVLNIIWSNPWHRFYLLTKQPQNLIKFSHFPDNCFVGVTATGAKMFKEALAGLSEIQAKVKYISLEPMLERIYNPLYVCQDMVHLMATYLDWLILGACTGTKAEMSRLCAKTDIPYINVKPFGKKWTLQPKIEWVKEIVEAADWAGIPVFLKDNLKPLLPKEPPFYTKPCADIDGQDPCYQEPCLSEHTIDECSKAPGFWRLRQEMPRT